jgi:septal ring factor EnvC (AmiA/AmiB activator)
VVFITWLTRIFFLRFFERPDGKEQEVERLQFNHDRLLKQVRSLQLQIKQEREAAAAKGLKKQKEKQNKNKNKAKKKKATHVS